MKTADLIPFILLELEDGDKYGFELTKNIETKSNSKIIIKQPTLYTLLKKLEKSKFISSYWEDSEIGGKRHYYRLTENGKLQLSTFPSYNELLKSAFEDETFEEYTQPTPVQQPTETRVSIMDELLNQQPVESILPTQEVFAKDNIDDATEMEINLTNADVLKDEKVSENEKFAENTQVSTFTEKIPAKPKNDFLREAHQPNNYSSTDILLNQTFSAPQNTMDIKHVDYVNFNNSKESKYSRTVASKKLLQVTLTSLSLAIVLVLCEVFVMFSGDSALFYLAFISSILIAIFNPVIFLSKYENYKRKHQQNTYKPKFKQKIIYGLILVASIVIVCVIANILMGNKSLIHILSISNFENIYAQLLMSLTYFVGVALDYYLVAKINKKEEI